MKLFFFALVIAALCTYLVIRFQHLHANFSHDHELGGVQKFHSTPVPRIGGVGIFTALVLTAVPLWAQESPHLGFFLLFLVPCAIVFAVGILEDLTKRVSVMMRLVVTMMAALIGCLLLGATVQTFDVPLIDTVFKISLVALLFTVVSVAGVSNAINLIDGFNGLSGFVCVTALVATAIVAYIAGDVLIGTIALSMAGAIGGFLLWNYPHGKIFMGDGGAYLSGFVIAELLVLLNERNPDVSVLFPLLLMIYPIFETLFSIYRRKFVRGRSPGSPDALHLHQVINTRIVRWKVAAKGSVRGRGNAATSPYLWGLNFLAAVPAVVFWDNAIALAAFILLFGVTYVWLYSRLVRFNTPRFLSYRILRGGSKGQVKGISAVQQIIPSKADANT